MSESRMITVSRGSGGYGSPPTITPDEKRNKIVYIVGGGQGPEAMGGIAELIDVEAVSGFSTWVPNDEHFCVVINCGGSLCCGFYPKKGVPTTSAVPTGKTDPSAQHAREGIYISVVGMGQVRPADANEAAGVQAAAAAESAQKFVPTREDEHPMKFTGQTAAKQKRSLLEKIGLGAGKVVTVLYQAGRNAVQMMINIILPLMGFVAMLIGITQTSGLGDWFSHLLTPLVGSSWGPMALGLICSLPFLSSLFGLGAVITQIIDILIGAEIGKGNIPSQLPLLALSAINTQNAYGFIPIDIGPGETEPGAIEVGVPAALYSRFLNGAPRVAIV